MKRLFIIFFIIISVLLSIFLLKIFVHNKIYSSSTDYNLSKQIENSVDLILRDKVENYSLDMEIPNIEYVCCAVSIYSPTASELLRDIVSGYKYSYLLEMKKRCFRRGTGTTLMLFIEKNKNVIPVFIPDNYYTRGKERRFEIDASNIIGNYEYCSKKIDKNIKINVTDSDKKAIITIK